jgi:phosphatidylserine synthase
MIILMVVLGLLMVSTLRYTSFKTVGKGRQSVYLLLIVAALGMLTWLFPQYMLFAIASTYVAHGIVWYLISFFRPRKRPIEASETNL